MRKLLKKIKCGISIDARSKTVFYERKLDFVIWFLRWPIVTLFLIFYVPILIALAFWRGLEAFWSEFIEFMAYNDILSGVTSPAVALWQMIKFKKKKTDQLLLKE